MSFFSLIQVDHSARNHGAQRAEWHRLSAKGAAYRDHCLMWKLFADASDVLPSGPGQLAETSEAEFLFRRRDRGQRKVDGAPEPLSFYVVSRQQPQAVPGLLQLAAGPKRYDPSLAAGDHLRFELRANPSVARKREGYHPTAGKPRRSAQDDVLMRAKHHGKQARNGQAARSRAELQEQAALMHTAAVDWLTGRAAHWGMAVDPDQLFADSYTQHQLQRGGETICFSSLDYSGTAVVTDPALLRSALLGGVGRKKSFGCGLLLVRRLG